MKTLSSLLFIAFTAASCAHYGNRTVASSDNYSNWERQPFMAGSSYYASAAYYRVGEKAPLSFDEAKKIVTSRLEEICQKSTSKSLMKDSVEFSFEDKRNNGGADFGDIILHPIEASMEKSITFKGSGKCETDDTQDQLVKALKEGVNHDVRENYDSAYINLYSFKSPVATAKVRVFKKKTQISADDLAPVKLAYTWKGLVTKQKDAVLETKNVEVLPEGDIFMKIDMKEARKNISSWNTNTGIRAYYNGKAVRKIYLGTNDQIGTIVIDLYVD